MPAAIKALTMTNLGGTLGRVLKALGGMSEESPRGAAWLTIAGTAVGWMGLDPEVIHSIGWGLIQLGGMLQSLSGTI